MTESAGDRVLSVPGNLRDLGGLAAQGGLTLKSGLVYRSAAPASAPEEISRALQKVELSRVVDLRSKAEYEQESAQSSAYGKARVWRNMAAQALGDPADLLKYAMTSADETRAVMTTGYARMPLEHASSFRALFGFLAKGETPLLFHCAAGKDRTGVAAAILLSLLGVQEADIYEDYLATNAAFDAIVERFLENPALAVVRDVDPDIWRPMLLADEAYLAAAFASIKTHAGGVESYARRFLGLSAGDIGEIRRILLR